MEEMIYRGEEIESWYVGNSSKRPSQLWPSLSTLNNKRRRKCHCPGQPRPSQGLEKYLATGNVPAGQQWMICWILSMKIHLTPQTPHTLSMFLSSHQSSSCLCQSVRRARWMEPSKPQLSTGIRPSFCVLSTGGSLLHSDGNIYFKKTNLEAVCKEVFEVTKNKVRLCGINSLDMFTLTRCYFHFSQAI